MGKFIDNRKWYVGYIAPKSDKKIINFVENNETCIKNKVVAWYPKITVETVKKGKKTIVREAMYPNYMLFKLPSSLKKNVKLSNLLLRSTSIICFLTNSKGKLIPLTDEEYENIVKISNQKIKIDYKELFGKTVFIIKGEYKGMIGKCKKKVMGKNKVLVYIEVDDKIIKDQINLDYLELYY